MAADNPRVRARRELEELGLSMESASYIVDDRPPGGWEALVTKDDLAAATANVATKEELEKLRTELHTELRAQTWHLAKLVAGAQGIVVVAIAAIGAVLRFA
jgi:hypothetical protein